MPDEKRISDLTTIHDSNITENTLVELSAEDQSSSSGLSSFSGALSAIFDKVLRAFHFTQRLDTQDTTVFGAINELAEDANIADQFSSSSTYAKGDYVIYKGTLYKCTSAIITAGAWDASKWAAVVVTDEMGQGGGGSANLTELTQAEYDALEQSGQLVEDMMYFITDGQSAQGDLIDDSSTSPTKVWSSSKTDEEISSKQDDLEGGGLSDANLNNYIENGNYWVTRTGMTNVPVDSFGYLEVIRVNTTSSSFICMQRFTRFGADNVTTRGETYLRFYSNSQWYNWFKVAELMT